MPQTSAATDPSTTSVTALVCHSSGLRYAHQEFDDTVDIELLIGTGVFGAYEVAGPGGVVKNMYFRYGFILEKVRDDSLIVVREAKSVLFDLCFHTGVCTDELEAIRNEESKLSIFLDMAYIPELHDGKTSSMKPTNETEDYLLLNGQPVRRIPHPPNVGKNDEDIELYDANPVGVDQPSDDGDGYVEIWHIR